MRSPIYWLVMSLLGAVILAAPNIAFPIGRSGNGRIASLEDGFSTESPKYFDQARELPNNSLRILAPTVRTSGSLFSPEIELRRYEVEFPQEVKLTRQETLARFALHGWWNAKHADPCVEVFLSDNESASSAVATWGEGRGVVMIGPKNGISKSAIREMLDKLTLEPGACGWN